MGEPAPIPTDLDEPPLHDPHSIARSLQYHRARRAARVHRRRERRWARMRFWFMLGCLVLAAGVIAVLILQQVQNIFGI
ncbi:MAG TPA: hypothetical protein VLJ76_10890 [Gaiellaceae bacterium]|nr:hypothetical protein [Gaiellaceae bacterium]